MTQGTQPVPSGNPILDAALEYLEMGFSVIPVQRANKKPYIQWEEYQHRLPTPEEVQKWWKIWPSANVAIVCGGVSTVFCVDSDGPEGTRWMNENLPPTTVYAMASRGPHAIYRVPKDACIRNSVNLAPQVDIRGDGGYFVAPPSTHATGHVYQWVFQPGGWDELPEYTPPTAGRGNLSIDLTSIRPQVTTDPVSQGSRNQTLAQLAGRWVSAGLDDWEISHLAMSWNAGNSPPLGEHEVQTTIASIRNTHNRRHPADAQDQPDLVPDLQPPVYEPFPEHLLRPGGLLEGILDYIDASSAVCHPVFSLAAAIPTIGSLVGHKFQTETGLKTNFYAITLGYAGAGKDSPQNAIPRLLLNTDASDLLGPNTLTSEAALLRYCADFKKAATVLFLDEIGLILKSLRRPNSSAFEVPAALMKLFSGVNRPYLKPYASGDDLLVHWHHIGLYGASTPSHFWGGFTRSEASDGFLARILIFESRHERSPAKDAIDTAIPKKLADGISQLRKIDNGVEGGNLVQKPVPRTIPRSPAAATAFQAWETKIIETQNDIQCSDEGIAAIYGRAAEHAAKLALLHAISLHGPKVTAVGPESVQWATELMDYQTAHITSQIKDNIAENEWHAEQQKIIRTIKRLSTADKPGVSTRDLQRYGVRCQPKMFDSLIQSMVSAGEIVRTEHKPKRGKPVVIFSIAKAID